MGQEPLPTPDLGPTPSRPDCRLTFRAAYGAAIAVCLLSLGLAGAATALGLASTLRFGKARQFSSRLASASVGGSGAVAAGGQLTIHAGQLRGSVPARLDSGDWLSGLGTRLYDADYVWPKQGQLPRVGGSVWIERSVPFSVLAGGAALQLRGSGTTTGEALASAGIYLLGGDYSDPPADAPLLPYQVVRLSRVQEQIEIQQRTTDFQTVWQPDPALELDQSRVVREGQEGVDLQRYCLVYVNAELRSRELQDEWVQQQPLDRMMAYGTTVVVRQIDSPSGALAYWRTLRVLVTSYSPSTAGPSPSDAHYGMTRTGVRAQTGIIAVDPSVIPLGTRIYVPGYGVGVAEDTGGMVLGKHIDVCYSDADLVSWYRWVDVYLLNPAPPEGTIRYVLPNWPKE